MKRCLAGWTLLALLAAAAWSCPSTCPTCTSWADLARTKKHPELGTVTMLCVSARCEVWPWCFEAIITTWVGNVPVEAITLVAPRMDFLTGPDVDVYIRDGVATICVRHGYEVAIPLGGQGELVGRSGIIKVPLRGLRGQACMGRCPCESQWLSPVVSISVRKTDNIRRPQMRIRAFDYDGDIICAGYRGLQYGKVSDPSDPWKGTGRVLKLMVSSRRANVSLSTNHLRHVIRSQTS